MKKNGGSISRLVPISYYKEVSSHAAVIICAWNIISSSCPSLLKQDFFESGRCSFQFTRKASILSMAEMSANSVCREARTFPRFRIAAILYVKEEKLASLSSKDSSS